MILRKWFSFIYINHFHFRKIEIKQRLKNQSKIENRLDRSLKFHEKIAILWRHKRRNCSEKHSFLKMDLHLVTMIAHMTNLFDFVMSPKMKYFTSHQFLTKSKLYFSSRTNWRWVWNINGLHSCILLHSLSLSWIARFRAVPLCLLLNSESWILSLAFL